MARLTEAMLNEGREAVRRQDLDGLEAWIKRTRVMIDIEVAKNTFRKCFLTGNPARALKMFDAAFTEADPVVDRVVLFGKLPLMLFVALGLLGGITYLFHR